MSENENGGALVPLQPVSSDLIAQLPDEWKGVLTGPQIYTSLDQSTPAGRMQVYAGLTGKTASIKDVINTTINIHNFLMHPVQKINSDTGELECFMRTVLYSETGEMYEAFSKGIAKSVMQIQHYYSRPPWNPPITVTVKDEGRDGRNWFVLRLAMPQAQLHASKGKPAKNG